MEKKDFSWGGLFLWTVCAGVLLVSFLVPLSALPKESLCWFYNLTHKPCPGCGLTRAFICISRGDWNQAFTFNPFSFVWYSLAVYFSLRPLLSRYLSFLSAPTDRLIKANYFFPTLVTMMILTWGYKLCF